MDKTKTLHQRINEVRKTNAYIKKEKTVQGGGYKAVTHDQVTAELRNDLIEQGVLIFPSIVAGTHRVIDTGTFTKNKVPFVRLEADVSVKFVNVDDSKDFEIAVIPAHAIDQGDKAPGKLISYAVKYAMLKVFSIETGEDDEGRADEYVEDGLSEEEIKGFQDEITKVANAEGGNTVWVKIKDACEAKKDERSKLLLRGFLSAHMTVKGIKSGKLTGGNGARAATH